MEKSKLVILLRTFDVWAMRGLRELVESPFFNKQQIVVQLLGLVEGYLKKSESVPELEDVHKMLWPELAYEHQRLRYVMTDLTRLVEEYLVQKQLEGKPLLQGRLLLEGLAARKEEKYFGQGLAKALEKLEKEAFRDADYHYERFRLHQLAMVFEGERKEKTGQDWLHPLIEDLQTFSFGTRLRTVCDLVNKWGGQVPEGDRALVEELRRRISKHSGAESPAIAIYETVLQVLTHPDAELYYRKLRMILRSSGNHFHRSELAHLYAFALSFSIQQLNKGISSYLDEIMSLYREQLEGKVLYENGIFPVQHFKNIVTVGIRVKEYDWTQQFIDMESPFLPETDRDGITTYSKAALQHALGEFQQSRKLLQNMRFADPSSELEATVLLMKSLYELLDFKALKTLTDRQLKLMNGKSAFSARERLFHTNFVGFLLRLVQFREGGRAPIGALIGEIEATREGSDLKWLRQKADEAARLKL